MKKLVMLAVAILGTTAMVNAQNTPAQSTPVKEAKVAKKDKKAEKTVKKVAMVKPDVAKVKK